VKPCLIFDLDGTLVDSLPGIAASLNRTLTAHGLSGHSDAAIRSFIGNGVNTLIQRAAPTAADPATNESLIGLFKKDYALSWSQGTQPYPGIHHLLGELQKSGFQMAVLSNKPHDFTVEMVRTIFPNCHFAKVLGQRDGIPHKPDPTGALQIANSLEAAPEQCTVVGDSTMDLETATNAGMKSIGVSWGYHDRKRLLEAGANLIIDQVADLQAALD
jgi:phosphoglycolate phosphatase